MERLRALPASVLIAVLGLAGGLSGCSDDDSGGDAAPEKPAVCDSVKALKSAGSDLKDMTVRGDGIGAIQDQLTTLQSSYDDVRSDAADEFRPQLDTVDTDLTTLKDNVTAATESPTLTTLADVGTGIRTLADDVTTLVDDIENTC